MSGASSSTLSPKLSSNLTLGFSVYPATGAVYGLALSILLSRRRPVLPDLRLPPLKSVVLCATPKASVLRTFSFYLSPPITSIPVHLCAAHVSNTITLGRGIPSAKNCIRCSSKMANTPIFARQMGQNIESPSLQLPSSPPRTVPKSERMIVVISTIAPS
ncbi:hypothetical protein BDV98DRAFT_569285 [Pterulicium gracile]|uniref:Uncharacterized protein n=1 Tax=Pterulicium gracile TaxID=1884261 RepID=A0A5C3QGJ7_9AGAR|nr:hypothetical protein BDV98DRAFT_569285 [Pterula gracilis]